MVKASDSNAFQQTQNHCNSSCHAAPRSPSGVMNSEIHATKRRLQHTQGSVGCTLPIHGHHMLTSFTSTSLWAESSTVSISHKGITRDCPKELPVQAGPYQQHRCEFGLTSSQWAVCTLQAGREAQLQMQFQYSDTSGTHLNPFHCTSSPRSWFWE